MLQHIQPRQPRRHRATLRLLRVIVSSLCMAGVTLLLVLPASALAAHLSELSRLQWLPAAMSFSLVTCIGWLVVTLIFGRIYCSSVCPLGTMMDIVYRLRRRRRPVSDPKVSFRYHAPMSTVRNVLVIATFVTLVLGIVLLAKLLDPYGTYARFCNYICRPLYLWHTPGFWYGCVIAIVTFVAVVLMAWKRGRLWCNTVCPVGTTLGYVSRHSLLRIDIDTDLCTHCRRCEWACKAECIDLTSHTVDGSRCINCFNCIDSCHDDAIRYTFSRKQLSIPMMQRSTPAATSTTLQRPH